MKRRAMKFLVMLTIMTSMLMAMVACGNDTVNETAKEQREDATVETTEKKEEATEDVADPVKIQWLGYNSYGVPDDNAEIVKLMEDKYNVDFEFWFLDTAKWAEMLAIKLSAGECPDFMKVPRNLAKYVDQGVVGEITQEHLNQMPNYNKLLDTYVTDKDDFFLDAKIDGKLYALKNISEGQPTTVIWRTDWLKNVGINKIPETIEEFEEAMYKFTFDDPDQNGKDDTYGMSENIMHMIFGAYAPMPLGNLTSKGECNLEFVKKDGRYMIEAIQPEMKEPLALLQKWYMDGVIDKEFITGENKGGYWAVSHSFVNGRIGVTGKVWMGHWRKPLTDGDLGGPVYKEMIALNPDYKFGENFSLGQPVKGPEGVSGTIGGGISGGLFAFSRDCIADESKMVPLLAMMDDTMGDYDQYKKIEYGLEDVHYHVDESQTIIRKEGFDTPQGTHENGLNVLNGMSGNPEYVRKANPINQAFFDEYMPNGHAGPKVPASEVLDKYKGDLSRYAVNFYIEVITGEKSIDEFDEFVKTFRENGGDAIEEDVNAIYQRTIGQ